MIKFTSFKRAIELACSRPCSYVPFSGHVSESTGHHISYWSLTRPTRERKLDPEQTLKGGSSRSLALVPESLFPPESHAFHSRPIALPAICREALCFAAKIRSASGGETSNSATRRDSARGRTYGFCRLPKWREQSESAGLRKTESSQRAAKLHYARLQWHMHA